MIDNLIKDIVGLAEEIPVENRSYEVVQDLKEYAIGFEYIRQSITKQRMSAYLESGWNYERALKLLADRNIATSAEALRTTVWYSNKQLRKILGDGVITLVQKEPELVRMRLVMARSSLKDVLPDDTILSLPYFKYMRYDLEECKYELLFLARFSISSLDYFKSKLDQHKLAYLRHILTEPSNEELSNAIEVMEWLKDVHTGGTSEYEMLNERIATNKAH